MMEDRKINEKIINDMDEAEAAAYKQIFGVFDKSKGDFISVKFESKEKVDLAEEVLWEPDDYRKDPDELDEFTFDLMTAVVGEESMQMEKDIRDTDNARRDVDKIISVLSEKEISSMAVTFKINGITTEYVNDEKAGEKYLPKEAQLDKIREVVSSFANVVVVYSQEELERLQEEYRKKHENIKSPNDKTMPGKIYGDKEYEIRTQVYIRISETDYGKIKDMLTDEGIWVMANKITTRDDKSGMNMIIKAEDADKVRNILNQTEVPILQDVDGNIDWVDIKERSKKIENVTVDQLRDFQGKNKDKYDYVAFRKDDKYTVFADKECDIAIGSEKKTLKQVQTTVNSYKDTNKNKTNEMHKIKGNKEAER